MLSRSECLKILEFEGDANSYEIETRYTLLLKRYRNQNDPETIARIDQITLAYNILTGRYVEPEPEDPRLEEVVLGKSRKQWRNLWHYGRWPLIFAVLGLSLVVYFVVSLITSKKPDFQVIAVGRFYVAGDEEKRVSDYVLEAIPGTQKISYQLLPIDLSDNTTSPSTSGTSGTANPFMSDYSGDGQEQMAFIMKMMALLAGDTIDVFVCDMYCFNYYAREQVFVDLTGLYGRLQDLPPEILAQIKPLRRVPRETESTLGDSPPTPTPVPDYEAMNQDTSLPICGLDVSALHLTEGLGLYSDTQVLTVGFRASDVTRAINFLETWIRDYERMHALQKDYEDKMKAAANAA